MTDPITITQSTADDAQRVWRLAALDDRRAPEGRVLLAYVGSELRAAVGVDDGRAVADPFHESDGVLELLRLQARHEVAA